LEYQATKLLNGKDDLEAIVQILNDNHTERIVDEDWLKVLIMKLRGANLMLASKQNALVKSSHRSLASQATRQAIQLLLSPLSIRVPVIRPKQFSIWFRYLSILLFHPVTIATTLVGSVVCSIMVLNTLLGNPERLVFDLRKIQGERWIAILASYLVVKSFHEIGHVLACARWGTSCKEIGFLFLFFTPCLYCDTTDSWKLPSKWQRAGIGAAGIYVELVIACLASIVWLTENEGLERTIAASIMLLCSIGTILLNGNPFFRYDGYYILSDLWGVPNLARQSTMALWRLFVSMLGGRKVHVLEFDTHAWGLAAFALISSVYRLTVLSVVMWLVWNILVPRGGGFLALLIFATTGVGILLAIYRFFVSLLAEFFAPKPIHMTRFLLFFDSLTTGVYFACTHSFPGYVRTRGYLDFAEKTPIYASLNGLMRNVSEQTKEPEHRFVSGETVFVLDNPEKRMELMDLQNELNYTKAKISILKDSSVNERGAFYELPPQLEIAKDLEAKLELLVPEIESLTQRAPNIGYFIPSNARLSPAITAPFDERLAATPIAPESLGCFVEKGTLLGWLSNKETVLFQSLVSENEIKSIKSGSEATCILDSDTSHSIKCRIIRLSPDPIDEMPQELLGDSTIIVERNVRGLFKPEIPHYQVTLQAIGPVPKNVKGSVATIHFQLASRTLLGHLVLYAQRSFRVAKN